MRLLAASLAGLLALSLASLAAIALDFPALTGRVVDQADVIGPVRTDVAAKSKDLEDRSTIQLVVATVPTLQGSSIEAYATQLFNTWRLGRADKNNGVLLLVAPNERKVRIEVGYGLESRLTNEICALRRRPPPLSQRRFCRRCHSRRRGNHSRVGSRQGRVATAIT
jgi:uncharacterized protein